ARFAAAVGRARIVGAAGGARATAAAVAGRVSDAALRDLAARAASGDDSARRALTGEARAQARDILAEGRFHEGRHGEGPLHGLFVTLGDWLEALLRAMPGGTVSGWVFLVVVIALVVAALALAATAWAHDRARRAAAGRIPGPGDVPGAAAAGPTELERRAEAAEQSGDLDAAIRLRFAAGLLRLDAAHAIELRPSLTSGDVGRALRSRRYDVLAATHDAVAYGGHHAGEHDAATARTEWPALVEEARRR
ncbi:MAG TPA: hypothetical protein VNT03_14510, partial [Baekduia sp.]|nr:hypothetical protein [Baekduia sp.]